MKKLSLTTLLFALLLTVGCTSQPKNQPQMALDMKTVNEYNAKVASGNTVPPSQRNKAQKEVDYPLNASDSRPRAQTTRVSQPNIAIVPSFGYYHHSGRYWRYW
ncbi:hypothetical protein EDC44_1254 [Cricetibacter osteomyelitidis]|uniref:Lipoprotein n=1 Tax=Cricetibacter osteomyelitidis TaxID=1521931 RepID=A0A4R2TBN3_9PAST|nr:hypothetical protein [Cricetibacter osteomyelitidis]TCP92162.1 hypothetical protein EDC44_1254 [Cricetibacter osteomyelitidis]